MSTRLDQQIEQLEKIVEARLNLCNVTWNETRCIRPANHDKDEPPKFDVNAR